MAVGGLVRLILSRRPWIGPIELDCSIVEEHSSELALTDSAIEALPGQPGSVTDHVVQLPRPLRIVGMVSNSPGRLISATPGPTRHLRAWRALLDLQRLREPIVVVTSLAIYSSMLIRRLATVRSASTTNALEIEILLREIQFASLPSTQALADAASDLALAEIDLGVAAATAQAIATLATYTGVTAVSRTRGGF